MIARNIAPILQQLASQYPVITVTGPRQSGKTTLAGQMHAIEIKAGATVNPDYFKGLKTFAAHHPLTLAGGGVIFGGAQGQPRSDWPVHSWLQLRRKTA